MSGDQTGAMRYSVQNPEEQWPRYLAQFPRATGVLSFGSGKTSEVAYRGEILVGGQASGSATLDVREIKRFALKASPVAELGGALSLIGPVGPSEVQGGATGQALRFRVRIYYPLLRKLGPGCEDTDATYPKLEILEGRLSWKSVEGAGEIAPGLNFSWKFGEGVRLHLGAVQSILGSVTSAFQELGTGGYIQAKANSLSSCGGLAPQGTSHEQRELHIRFVTLALPPPADLEDVVKKLLSGACEVWWKKCGVLLVPQAAIDLANPTVVMNDFPGGRVTSSQESDVDNWVGQDPDRVDVYLVNELVGRDGGAVTHLCGTSDAYVIVDINKARHNDYLLAHELGHVLGLRHPGNPAIPGDECQSYREGSYCSVMVPDRPDSSRNTENNISVTEAGWTPNNLYPLVPLEFRSHNGLKCNWNTDAEQGFFHIIRDLPYDDGTESSPLHLPFVDRWTHSDVWNSGNPADQNHPERYANGGAMFDDDNAPVHSEPTCAGTNYMFVRVHACQPLPNPVNVALYLADPGSPPKVAQLVPLNPAGNVLTFNPPSPKPGAPAVQSLVWSFADIVNQWPGYPPQCCVYAIATSAGEPSPIANLAAATFGDLWALLATDNDIAQRNLHIQGCTPPPPPGRHMTPLPWLLMANPFPDPRPAWLEIDTRAAPQLAGLVLEVNEKILDAQIPIGGEPVRIMLAEELRPDEGLVLRFQATLPDGAAIGESFPVSLRFLIGDQIITGYQHVVRVVPLAETVAQTLDGLFGALRDAGVGLKSAESLALAETVKGILSEHTGDPEKSLTALRTLSVRVGSLVTVLNSAVTPVPEHRMVADRLLQFGKLLEAPAESAAPGQFVEQVRDLADRIQGSVAQLARLKHQG